MQKNIVQCVKNCKVRDHFGTGTIWGRSLVAFGGMPQKATKLRPQMVLTIASNYGQLQFLSIFQVMVKMLEYLQIQNKKRRT